MNQFFIYKEYGAKYEMMIDEMESAQRALPAWETYQRGFEALAGTLVSAKDSENMFKKSLTLNDLLVKVCHEATKAAT